MSDKKTEKPLKRKRDAADDHEPANKLVTLEVKTSMGRYAWCYGVGEHLLATDNDLSSREHTLLLDVTVDFSALLKQNQAVDKVVLSGVDKFGDFNLDGVYTYSVRGLKDQETHRFRFPVHPCNINHDVRVLLLNKRQEVHSTVFTVPQIKVLGDEKSCAICLEDVKDFKYVTQCHHQFHISCLMEYLKAGDKLDEPDWCQDHCCNHKRKTKFNDCFLCPVCRTSVVG